MKTLVSDVGPCRKKLAIEIPAEKVAASYERAVAAYASRAAVPGFRPGRAPRAVVERRFAKDILSDVRDDLVPDAYREALRAEKLDPVAILDIQEKPVRRTEPLSFEVTLDVPPTFEMPEYKGIKLQAEKTEVDEARVGETIEGLRRQRGRPVDVTGRPVQDGDLVQVDFEGSIDGRPIAEFAPEAAALGKTAGFWLRAGDDTLFPGLTAGLKGAAIGERRTVAVAFPADLSVKAIAGRTAAYVVDVKAIRIQEPAPIDKEFLQPLGVESEEALRERVRTGLKAEAEQAEERRRQSEIVKTLLARTTMDLPESLVQQETQDLIYDTVQRNARRGVPQDVIVQHKQDIFAHASQDASEGLKFRYIAHRIAEAEGLRASDEDLDAAVASMAQAYDSTPEVVRARLEEHRGLDELRHRLTRGKVLDFLLKNAQIV